MDSVARLIVVDGYNVLHVAERFRPSAEEDLDAARARLVSDVAAYVGSDEHAIVVFDGAENPASNGTVHTVAGIDVIFSAHGVEADSVIEDLIVRRRAGNERVVLVTSDQTLQWTTMGGSVTRMSSAEFAREIVDERAERHEYAWDGSSAPLDRRLDADTRQKLALWARGQLP